MAPASAAAIALKDAPQPAPDATPQPAAAKPAQKRVFRVQVGAFREAGLAHSLSRRLTHAGFPTEVIPGTTSKGTPIFRVRTRQALPKGEALRLIARLRHREPALRPFLVAGGSAG